MLYFNKASFEAAFFYVTKIPGEQDSRSVFELRNIVANPVPSSAEAGNVKLVHGSAIFLNKIIGFPNGLVGLIKKFR